MLSILKAQKVASGVETDSDGAISRAQALMLSFKLKDTITTEQNAAWAENFIEQVGRSPQMGLDPHLAHDAPRILTLQVLRHA